jgi:non-ribosomal peptide synthetase component F
VQPVPRDELKASPDQIHPQPVADVQGFGLTPLEGLAMQTFVGDLISNAAARFGDKTALIFEDRSWSFRELDRASSKLAGHLQRLGLRLECCGLFAVSRVTASH